MNSELLINKLNEKKITVAVIGLGYVGLPLAVKFAGVYTVIGFDISERRVTELNANLDKTGEVSDRGLEEVRAKCTFTNDESLLSSADVFIVTVPTPVDSYCVPDLAPLTSASQLVARNLSVDSTVIYESTVFPGATEEICLPIIESISGLKMGGDFYLGYSPERINPGDKENTIESIVKVTSGNSESAREFVDALYRSVITAGTFSATSIKVAEAAKVIENSQRDINIAFVNELAQLFWRLGIDTKEVLDAAATKWNFIDFRPGLVGGHCIGVDPYYLAYKAREVGFHPEVLLAGRRTNDGMPAEVSKQIIKKLIAANALTWGGHLLVLGYTFKENCPDVRNTKVEDLIVELESYGLRIDVVDPVAAPSAPGSRRIHKVPQEKGYAAIIAAVPHDDFAEFDVAKYLLPGGALFDLKDKLSWHHNAFSL